MRPAASPLLLLVLACGSVAAAPEAEPWTGILPDPGGENGAQWFVTRVLDARTGAPVTGARLVRTPESIAPERLRHDAVIGVATTDADGIAVLPTTPQWTDDCHWIVQHEGYAPTHTYGKAPDAEMLLERGVPFRGRVLDAMGRVVAGALVETLGGCSHGTATASVRTDAAGHFEISLVEARLPGQIWVEGPSVAADLIALDGPRALYDGAVELVMGSCIRYVGRLVDPRGVPVEGAVVRAWNEQRGPTARTDADGRFVLDGVEDSDLVVYHPADLLDSDAGRHVDDAYHDVEMTVVVSPLGVREEDDDARVAVRTRDGDGNPVGLVAYRILGVTTGRGPSGTTEASGADVAIGTQIEDVVPGRHVVHPDDPFDVLTFAPVPVTAPAGATTPVDVVLRRAPRLRIEGDVPEDARLALAIPGAETSTAIDGPAWSPGLPATGLAVLRVEIDDRPPFFFRVGPLEGGMRRVRVEVPPPTRVVASAGSRRLELRHGHREAYFAVAGPELTTDATGRHALRWDDADGRAYEADVRLPARVGGRVVVDPDTARVRIDATTVRVLGDGDVLAEEAGAPGELLRFEIEGWRTSRVRAPAQGTRDVRLGPSALRLRVVDGQGAPVDALVLAGGEVYAAPEGALSLRGFAPGPLRVVVARRGHRGGGRMIRPTLTEGEPGTRTVVLDE